MNILLRSILLCSIGQEGSDRPRSYYRSFIAFVQLGFVAANGKDEVAVSVKDGGNFLEAYVAETEDGMSSKIHLFSGEWNKVTESFSITGLPARGGFDRASSERLESMSRHSPSTRRIILPSYPGTVHALKLAAAIA